MKTDKDRPSSLVMASAILFAALASCGPNQPPDSEAAMENRSVARLQLNSDAFTDGQPIPAEYTCDGVDRPPPLKWHEPPAGTKSFALVSDDPDAPSGTFRHWGVIDIPVRARSIGGDQRVGTEVTNDFGKLGYGGPCAPRGSGPHHYHFKLFALDVASLGLSSGAKVMDVENAARQHAIAEGEMVGSYERK